MPENSLSVEEKEILKKPFELIEFLHKHYKIFLLFVSFNLIFLISFIFFSMIDRNWNWLNSIFQSDTLNISGYMELLFFKIFNYVKLTYAFLLIYLIPGILIANLIFSSESRFDFLILSLITGVLWISLLFALLGCIFGYSYYLFLVINIFIIIGLAFLNYLQWLKNNKIENRFINIEIIKRIGAKVPAKIPVEKVSGTDHLKEIKGISYEEVFLKPYSKIESIAWGIIVFIAAFSFLFASLVRFVPYDTDAQGFGFLALVVRDGCTIDTLEPFSDIKYIYGPIYFITIAFLSNLTGAIIPDVMVFFGGLSAFLIVIFLGYVLTIITKKRIIGIIGSFFIMYMSHRLWTTFLDTGYTSLFGHIFLLIFIGFLFLSIRTKYKRYIVFSGASFACLMMTHPDTLFNGIFFSVSIVISLLIYCLVYFLSQKHRVEKTQSKTKLLNVFLWEFIVIIIIFLIAIGFSIVYYYRVIGYIFSPTENMLSKMGSLHSTYFPTYINTIFRNRDPTLMFGIFLILDNWIEIFSILFLVIGIIAAIFLCFKQKSNDILWYLSFPICLILIIDFGSFGIINNLLKDIIILGPIIGLNYPFMTSWRGPMIFEPLIFAIGFLTIIFFLIKAIKKLVIILKIERFVEKTQKKFKLDWKVFVIGVLVIHSSISYAFSPRILFYNIPQFFVPHSPDLSSPLPLKVDLRKTCGTCCFADYYDLLMFEWIRENTEKDIMILNDNGFPGHWVPSFTERKCVFWRSAPFFEENVYLISKDSSIFTNPTEEDWEMLLENNVTHILTSDLSPNEVFDTVVWLEQVHEINNAVLYHVIQLDEIS